MYLRLLILNILLFLWLHQTKSLDLRFNHEQQHLRSTETDILSKVPLYKIDLNQNPKDRWKTLAVDYKSQIQAAIRQYIGTVPQELHRFAKLAGNILDTFLPKDYADEIRGISEAANVTLGDAVLINVIYDVTAHCTGLIAGDKRGGVWHGRNLDYGSSSAQTGVLEAATVRVDFLRNGSLQFSSVTFAGYVGLLTGWKPHAFGITINQREAGSLARNLLSAAEMLLAGKKLSPVSMLARLSLEEDTDYSSVTRRLTVTQLIAPVYYIVSGTGSNEGQVIVRDQFSTLGVNRLNAGQGRWFLVQTNYDFWLPPPASDLDRWRTATKLMNQLSPANISINSLLHVLSHYPVLNSKTAYSSVFSAAYFNQSVTVVW